jgi:23S rRNA pseudouridine2605 synthase
MDTRERVYGIRDTQGRFCYQAAVMTRKGDEGGQYEGERIAKAIARAGLASRREAEAWIAAGRVVINGEKIKTPARNVTPADRVVVDGKPLPVRERTRLFLFHKTRGLVTTHADPQGRPTVFDALPKHLPRLISVGRLDANTEGLLLLTNDGGLARMLELPATGWTRRYRVRANGTITQLRLDRLRHGIEIDGVTYGPIEARLDREQGANVWLTFAMREGKNREVKNVLGHLGLAVNRLIRVSFGPFQLGDLPEGAVDEVRTRHLREQLGERVATAAGLDFAGPVADQERASSARRPEAPAEGEPRNATRPGRGSPRDRHGKGAGRQQPASGGRPFEGRAKARPPQDDVAKRPAQNDSAKKSRGAMPNKKPRRHGPDRLGEPERARQERRSGKRPLRGKPR